MTPITWFWIVLDVLFIFFVVVFFYMRRIKRCTSSRMMNNRTVIITGASSGIGLETARELAKRKARVILACRNVEKANVAADDIIKSTGWHDVVVKRLDLCSFKSIRTFASEIIESESRIDVLVNNAAAVPYGSDLQITEDGLELQYQTNYFGHFLLTILLLPILMKSAPARVINVSSVLYKVGKLSFDNFNQEKKREGGLAVYASTKLALVLFTRELARRLQGTRIVSCSCTPGTTNTNIARNVPWIIRRTIGAVAAFLFFRSPAEGAQTLVHLSVSENVDEVSNGKYFVDCEPETLIKVAQDDGLASKLWEVSERLTGISNDIKGF